MAAPEGPRRFECPTDFCPFPFSPGPAFSRETLRSPSKQLWLIRAPADFCPESLDGHVVPLSGSQMLKVPQPDGMQKIYCFQATPGDLDSAHLLIPSGHRDHLTCAPAFSGALSICERFGNPSANQLLYPVAARQAPEIPEGLRQRFLPFGGHPKSPSLREVAEEPLRKRRRKKKRQLYTGGCLGDPEEPLPPEHGPCPVGASAVPAGDLVAPGEAGGAWEGERGQRPKKGQQAVLPAVGAVQQPLPEQGSQLSSHREGSSQESLSSGEVMDPSCRSKKKKKKKKQKQLKEEALLEPSSLTQQQPEREPSFLGNPEASVPGAEGLGHCKPKKRRRREEEEAVASMDAPSVKEEAGGGQRDFRGPGATPEDSLSSLPSGIHKRRRKRKEEEEEEVMAEGAGAALLEPSPVKQEAGGWDELGPCWGQGMGQEEPLLPSVEGTGQKHKKKKKKRKREAAEEESWAS